MAESQFTKAEIETAISAIKDSLSGVVQNFTLPNGMSVNKINKADQIKLIRFYESELTRIDNEERLALGLGSKRKIRTRFV